MQIKKVLILTAQEVRQALAEFVVAGYVLDPELAVESLLTGKAYDFSDKGTSDRTCAELYRNWGVGKQLCQQHQADMVEVKTGNLHDVLYDNVDEPPTREHDAEQENRLNEGWHQ